jgi:hypothetical protein
MKWSPLFAAVLASAVNAEVSTYTLNRVIVDDVIVTESTMEGPQIEAPAYSFTLTDTTNQFVNGYLSIHEEDGAIVTLNYHAQSCTPCRNNGSFTCQQECYTVTDYCDVLNYSNDGRIYRVFSRLTNDEYDIHFIRRGSRVFSVDPTAIFMLHSSHENRRVNFTLFYRLDL